MNVSVNNLFNKFKYNIFQIIDHENKNDLFLHYLYFGFNFLY